MESVLKAISEPNRRLILQLVAEDELNAGEISKHFNITRPAISQHLTVLKQAGLISERRQGVQRLYQARRQGFAEARLFLEGFWDDRLGRLRRAVEQQHTTHTGEMTERLSVEREIFIDASPETVWALLTDADEATRWMGRNATFDPSPGGGYRTEVVPGQVVVGEFVDIDPPHRLAHTWGWEGDANTTVPVGSTIVTYELLPTAGGTLLRLTHRDLPSVDSAGSHSRGWGHYLERLATVASGGTPGPDPWFSDPERLKSELRP